MAPAKQEEWGTKKKKKNGRVISVSDREAELLRFGKKKKKGNERQTKEKTDDAQEERVGGKRCEITCLRWCMYSSQ